MTEHQTDWYDGITEKHFELALEKAASKAAQPDCRTCFYGDTPDEFNEYQWKCLSLSKVCINGNRYKPFERVVLWRTEP